MNEPLAGLSGRLVLRLVLACGVLGLALLLAGALRAAAGEAAPTFDVVGTEFRVSTGDGNMVTGAALVGAVLTLSVNGAPVRALIAGIEEDPENPGRGVFLHDLRLLAEDGSETPFCLPGPDGIAAGFPLAGRSDGRGVLAEAGPGEFEFICTAGALGKCVRFGYRPWETGADGRSMREVYNACVRMVRADWCGDGRGHTVDGTLIGFTDSLGINTPEEAAEDPEWATVQFEAAWGPEGAVCVARQRLDQFGGLDAILAECPRLAGRLGPEACAPGRPDAILESWSR